VEIIPSVFVALFGCILGSFFNVLIWRLPREESIVWPGSHCTKCKRPIRAWENIPVFSYLFLRGRCAGCKQTISPLYPAVELVTASGSLFLFLFFLRKFSTLENPLTWSTYIHITLQSIILLSMIPIIIIDFQHYIIPNQITYPIILISIIASFLPGDTTPLKSGMGILAGGGTLFAIGWLGKIIFRKGEAMGGGDIKLLAAIGALWGPKVAFLTIMFGSIFGSFAAIVLIILRRLNEDHHIPFGPYLAAGVWTSVLAGDVIVNSYLILINNISFIGR
jgi:leader peptidase (prepilin peptidase) / N-methyltransferase